MNAIKETISSIIKNWWWFIIKGLLLIIAGVVILANPLAGYTGLSLMFSLVILGVGFSQILFSLGNKEVLKGWGWTLASGIIDVIIGTYLFVFPLITMATLPIILGFWLILRSFYLMGAAFDLKNLNMNGWGWVLFGGIVVAILAFTVLYFPATGAISIIAFSASGFILAGIFNLMLAFKLKAVKAHIENIKSKL